MLYTFFLIFGEATSSHVFRETTSTQQRLFRVAISSEQLLFSRSSFFRKVTFLEAVIFSEQLLFQGKTSTEQPLFGNRKFFRAVTFWNSYLLGGGIVQSKGIATFPEQVHLQSIIFFRNATFWKKLIFLKSNIPHYLLSLESYTFRAATFSKDVTYYGS